MQIVGIAGPKQKAIITAYARKTPPARNHLGHEKLAGRALAWTANEVAQIKAALNRGDYKTAASKAKTYNRPHLTAAQVREQTSRANRRAAMRAEYLRLISIP